MSKMAARIIKNTGLYQHRLLLGIPTTGIVRMEWAAARYGQIIPVNWSCGELLVGFADQLSPIGYLVHDARNIVVGEVVKQKVEWLLFIDHDVILPPTAFQRFAKYIDEAKYPIVSGLYYSKGEPSEPLVFRGRGNGCFYKWKDGDRVWVDGVPCGCLLIHASVLEVMWESSEEYALPDGRSTRLVFNTPRNRFFDPESGVWQSQIGTEDLFWCDRVMKEDVLHKAGWRSRRWPFLLDTSIKCGHIDSSTGRIYP